MYVHLSWPSFTSSYFILNCKSFFPFTRWTWKKSRFSLVHFALDGSTTIILTSSLFLPSLSPLSLPSPLSSPLSPSLSTSSLCSGVSGRGAPWVSGRKRESSALVWSMIQNWASSRSFGSELYKIGRSNWDSFKYKCWGSQEKIPQRGRLEWPVRCRRGCWLWLTESATHKF